MTPPLTQPLTQPPAQPGPAWDEAWSQALEALELDVDTVETLLDALHRGQAASSLDLLTARWEPPSGLGPMPRPLVERATALLHRQRQIALRVAEATHLNRRHARATTVMRDKVPSSPVYLDVAI